MSGGECSLGPIRPPSGVNREVYKALRRAITSGELSPGQRIVEETLANQLGVSLAPLREATGTFERDGLAERELYVRKLPGRHLLIVRAIARRDCDAARRAIYEHIQSAARLPGKSVETHDDRKPSDLQTIPG
jgi:DNA-binding GntR family transcriptional regulator